jgi:hypothetical protein
MIRSLAALAVVTSIGCSPARAPAKPVSQAMWTDARSALATMRNQAPDKPYVQLIRVALHEPRSGRVLEGRGAVAVDPHPAMRMVLVGPGGRTALDVWVTKDAWRFAIPALELVRRGRRGEVTYDLPVGFFRWWFLGPLDGRLLTVDADARGRGWVLRDDGATVVLHELGAHHFVALRRESTDVDRLEWVARSLQPSPGDRARYQQRVTGLEVEVLVESLAPDPPDPAAFVDPDDMGVAL